MRWTGFRGVVGLLILLLVIFAIGFNGMDKGFDTNLFADETSEDDGDSDYGPTEMA